MAMTHDVSGDAMAAADRCASLGGEGWQGRFRSHADELANGQIWARCGQSSEVGRLRAVLLAWPGDELDIRGSPRDHLMREPVNLARIREQASDIANAYRRCGVEVHWDAASRGCPPNYIFMRDLFFMTPEGAIVARMASAQRAGEERHAALALARLGVPIVATALSNALFEGADALWLGPREVVVGVGRRTNTAGFALLSQTLERLGITAQAVPAAPEVQHLLGCLNFVDRDLVTTLVPVVPELRALLAARGIRCIELAPTPEVAERRAMNFVCTSPRTVLMPARCPDTRALLESHGISCHEVEISEYLAAAGGLGCLTGILWRDCD